jgi:hypothetical protein
MTFIATKSGERKEARTMAAIYRALPNFAEADRISSVMPRGTRISVEITLRSSDTEMIDVHCDDQPGAVAAALAAVDQLQDRGADSPPVDVDEEELPWGVYGVVYYTWRGNDFVQAGCDNNITNQHVRWLKSGQSPLARNEVAVVTCRSQPGGCTIYGSVEMRQAWLDLD